MALRFFSVVHVCLLAVLIAPTAGAQVRNVTPTRGVVVFSQRESELAKAAGSGDEAAIGRLLAADFEQHAASGDGQTRDAWLQAQRGAAAPAFEHMTVYDYGTVAVATFTTGDTSGARNAVVDVWRSQGSGWQLQLRFVAPAPAAPPGDIKPDGKG
jgi:hypothetical protein